jgi:DNA adenine methylase
MTFNNKSPLRYPGGKTRACKKLDDILITHFTIKNYKILISPFFGGGSFEFFIQNTYELDLIVNDKFIPLYNFWKQVKTNKTLLCSMLLNKLNISKEDFLNYRSSIMDLYDNPIQQAFQYFIINRCSFNGATLSGGFSEESSKKRYTKSSISRIEALDLTKLSIDNMDFIDFIQKYIGLEHSLIFLDPPYCLDTNSKLYGKNGDLHDNFDHHKLFTILDGQKNWIMTYNDCFYIRELYKKYIIIDLDWKYGMNKSKKSSEIVILSK